jgi:hypothetical protein
LNTWCGRSFSLSWNGNTFETLFGNVWLIRIPNSCIYGITGVNWGTQWGKSNWAHIAQELQHLRESLHNWHNHRCRLFGKSDAQ